jgi:hypothetical protein
MREDIRTIGEMSLFADFAKACFPETQDSLALILEHCLSFCFLCSLTIYRDFKVVDYHEAYHKDLSFVM